ncbi:MAG: DsbA family protein [Candidatus Riflebacteria bacterium]|nr:DsbA family protein [Candidatus Riflebacteria bacterium]
MSEEQIRFYFDFLCPYSYIGWLHFKQALSGKGLSTVFHAVGSKGDSARFDAPSRWEKLTSRGKKLGVSINKPRSGIDSAAARRGMACCTDITREVYIDAVFRAVFQENVDISNGQTLIDFLQKEGVDHAPLQKALDDPQSLKFADDAASLWETRHLELLPTIEIGEDRYAGIIDGRGLENLLARVIF